jgi:meiotically up-regulated gene 157 (Mug157) protein
MLGNKSRLINDYSVQNPQKTTQNNTKSAGHKRSNTNEQSNVIGSSLRLDLLCYPFLLALCYTHVLCLFALNVTSIFGFSFVRGKRS